MTAGERLVLLAGTGGVAATLLLAIGSGATSGAALVNYSQLASGTAAEHLLVDHVAEVDVSRPRGSFVKFQPVRGGAGVVEPIYAKVAVYSLQATGQRASVVSVAGFAHLAVSQGAACTGELSARGVVRVSATAKLQPACGKVQTGRFAIQAGAGTALAPCVAVISSITLSPQATGVAGVYPVVAGGLHAELQSVGIQNLTDEELIGLFLHARRKNLLTDRVNHL